RKRGRTEPQRHRGTEKTEERRIGTVAVYSTRLLLSCLPSLCLCVSVVQPLLHSCRRAATGSTRTARRAGHQAASVVSRTANSGAPAVSHNGKENSEPSSWTFRRSATMLRR